MMSKEITFIDLFAGIGGIRLGLETACREMNIKSKCVFTSEIKAHAREVLIQNHPFEVINGDITHIKSNDIPDFDILLGGFPCQAFSFAGKRNGFNDARGTLFFEVARILKDKKPKAFLLENVEGLITHNKVNKNDKIGSTLQSMIDILENLGYKVSYKVLNSADFGLAQDRKRIYIVGSLGKEINLDNFKISRKNISTILEHHEANTKSDLAIRLLKYFDIKELAGKSIKDKRGGKDNIHSWDIALKGEISQDEKDLLNNILLQRRKKIWAIEYGIDWMDGMPLSLEQIKTFYHHPNLEAMLEKLVKMNYLKKEHPKKKINNKRVYDESLPRGYNIVTGKLSFEISKILGENDIAPTLVATDMDKIFVIDRNSIRPLTLREGMRLFGYPDTYKLDVNYRDGIDLLGNTVAIPVVTAVSKRLLKEIK